MRSFVRRHQLATFLVFAFVLSWWPWPLTLLNEGSVAMIPWGPAIAAVLVTWLALGRPGLVALFGRLVQWRVAPRWYLAALGIPVLAWGGAALVATALFDSQRVAGLVFVDLLIFPISLVTTALVNGPVTEELGWRGVALPRMLTALRPLAASLVLGGVWSLWHLPLLMTDPTRPIVPFTLSVMAFSVILTWLHLATSGSLLIAVLFHSGVNTVASFVVPGFEPDDRITVWWVFVAVIVASALAVARTGHLREVRAESFSRRPEKQSSAASKTD